MTTKPPQTALTLATTATGPLPLDPDASVDRTVAGLARGGKHKGSKVERQVAYVALIQAIVTDYEATDRFYFPSGSLTRDQLVAKLRSFVVAAETTKGAMLQWRLSVAAERALEAEVQQLRDGLRGMCEMRFGKSGTALLRYGYVPRKATVKTSASKLAAAAKSRATRLARGTRGSVQKRAVKGDVTGVMITPVLASGEPPTE